MSWFGWKKYCQQLQGENRQLRQDNARLKEHNAQLEAQNRKLTEALAAATKTSGNSSKPPSSDIVKPAKDQTSRGKRRRRKIGAQKGHPKHQRAPFPAERIDRQIPHSLGRCPVNPIHRIDPAPERQRVLQQIELSAKPFEITQHVADGIWCHDCHCYHDAPFPPEVQAGGLFGPRLSALVVYLKGRLHGSHSAIRDFLREVMGVEVSRGYLAKLLAKSAQAFEKPFAELLASLPEEPCLNVDETGHKENGHRLWTWCFRAARFVLFKIEPSRSTEVLVDTLGEGFEGILGCDYYAAYRKYARECHVLVQFCLAHLIRDVKYLCEFPNRCVQAYGQNVLRGVQCLFGTLHRKERLSTAAFQRQLEAAREQIWEAALEPVAFPKRFGGASPHRLIANMARRFLKHGEGYFQFITTPQIDPTNNAGEQAMRFVVMDRHITQGTRSCRGRRFCERLWTVMGTCSIQRRSAFQWMCHAITAHFAGSQPPSLLPDSS